jgi:phage baseplate assembly protein W
MAVQISYRHPLDIDKRVAIGVAIPFNGPAVFNPIYLTSDQIKSNIINYVLTNKGEKLFQPNYGADLKKMIFENINENNLKTLEIKLTNDIQNTFPNIKIQSLIFSQPTFQEYSLQLDISYTYFNDSSQNIQILL